MTSPHSRAVPRLSALVVVPECGFAGGTGRTGGRASFVHGLGALPCLPALASGLQVSGTGDDTASAWRASSGAPGPARDATCFSAATRCCSPETEATASPSVEAAPVAGSALQLLATGAGPARGGAGLGHGGGRWLVGTGSCCASAPAPNHAEVTSPVAAKRVAQLCHGPGTKCPEEEGMDRTEDSNLFTMKTAQGVWACRGSPAGVSPVREGTVLRV